MFRAAYELGIETVAIYTWEDRQSLHRMKADEAYQIGEKGHPLKPYLTPEFVVRAALESEADAIHPGYGFMSENPDLAQSCEEAGITFVGPSTEVLRLCGNKMKAQSAAQAARLPVLRQSEEVTAETATVIADEIGFPLFVKAASGGGGRGLRRVDDPSDLASAVDAARREAESAFGDPTVFLETAVLNPRHIEVQLIGDGTDVVHLYERDCSVQRRHQKVVEMAPAPNLDTDLRDQICDAAVRFGQQIGYRSAGTVEFLVDESANFVFIELNPRIQVEHTVTEETTDIDIVQAQLRIASGETLADMGLVQGSIVQRGAALQCRITTEDPTNGFRPDIGRILAYREPGGAGIRLDGGGGYSGAQITPYFDSLLTKLTCRGRTMGDAIARTKRALAEFRVRGPATNIGFLQAVMEDPEFIAGAVTTSFIDERPYLMEGHVSSDRATRLLRWIGETTVNRPYGEPPEIGDPVIKLGPRPQTTPTDGSKQRLERLGPEGFARWMRESEALLVTDTTLRDAHQSILATRIRTIDLSVGARHIADRAPQLLSLECWGGATFDVALRYLHEDPWVRLERIRDAAPNICLQMLLRGRNTVGYTPYPTSVAEAFVSEARATGIDVFRVFDALNSVEQILPAVKAAVSVGGLVEGTLCYSGNLLDPEEDLYTLDYYLRIAEKLVESGVHVLCIKDMAGLLRAPSAHALVTALRERFAAPVHLHTHDTGGGQLATYYAAAQAGVDAIDGAAAPLAGMTSQPALGAIVAAFADTERDTGLSMDGFGSMEPYWEAVRALYAPFEAGLSSPTGTVYHHEIPGGQISNLRQQAIALGLGDRWEQVEKLYAACDRLLGRIIKVTPTSKVVGDLALYLAASGLSPEELLENPRTADLPDSVIGFLHGELGTPEGGFPEPFRTMALEGRREAVRVIDLDDTSVAALGGPKRRETLNSLLFPKPYADFVSKTETYGDLFRLPTKLFLYGMNVNADVESVGLGRGVNLLVGLDAIGEPDERGMRRAVFVLNGQLRPLDIRDSSIENAASSSEPADSTNPGHVAAPFTGVVTIQAQAGDTVVANQPIALIEAMKMESVISAPVSGVLTRVVGAAVRSVEAGDLLAVIAPA